MTGFDRFVECAWERKLPTLTLDLAIAFSYRLSSAELVRIRKDSVNWGYPHKDNYPMCERGGKDK